MEKKTLEQILFCTVLAIGIGVWLWIQYPEQQKYPDNYLYSESVEHFLQKPEKGDLYVILNKDEKLIEYFKVIGLGREGQLGITIGTDSTHLLTKKPFQPNWVIDMLSEDIASWDSLGFKEIDQLTAIVNNNAESSLKIFRLQWEIGAIGQRIKAYQNHHYFSCKSGR